MSYNVPNQFGGVTTPTVPAAELDANNQYIMNFATNPVNFPMLAVDAGSTNNVALTVDTNGQAVNVGATLKFKPLHTNTGATHITVNGATTVWIKKQVAGVLTDIAPNDLVAGAITMVHYTGPDWVLSQPATLPYLPLVGGTMTGTLNMGGNAITNVPTPGTSTAAANRQYVDDATTAIRIPVGYMAMNNTGANPGAPIGSGGLGYGTWVNVGTGQYIGSAGAGNDGTDGFSIAAGSNTGGAFKYKNRLTVGQLAQHSHALAHPLPTYTSGKSTSSGSFTLPDVSSGITDTNTIGNSDPIDNTPPVYGVYFFLRTA